MTGTTAVDEGRQGLAAWRAHHPDNHFTSDPFAVALCRRLLGEGFGAARERLERVGAEAALRLDGPVAESNRDENLPVLRRFDGIGRRTEEVVFHPAYHEAGRVFWGSGVLELLGEPGHEVLAGALLHLLGHAGEGGHLCPVACTAGAIKLLQLAGSDEQRREWLPLLASADYDRRVHAAQFVTEVQGGSDVGANACRAVADPGRPGWFRLSGEKWFCSVADAGLFVVSARPEASGEGTRGLGLFLVSRRLEGEPNGFSLRRLKTKLGTRSMATGEIDLEGALAQPVGPLDQGFRNLVGIVLDTSRVHNALGCSGLMRRAFVEAWTYAGHRDAFGRRIGAYPAVRSILARMKLRAATALASTLRIMAMSDRLAAHADSELAGARRLAVMINKYWTAVRATASARDGIEVLGGNGTVEEFSPLPRLYRDAIVLESWEGTHNTLCAQVLRDIAARGLHRPWLAMVEDELAAVRRIELADAVRAAARALECTRHRIERLLAGDEGFAAAHVRRVVDGMCRLTDLVVLLEQAQWNLEHGGGSVQPLVELQRLLEIDPADPMDSPRLGEVQAAVAAAL